VLGAQFGIFWKLEIEPACFDLYQFRISSRELQTAVGWLKVSGVGFQAKAVN